MPLVYVALDRIGFKSSRVGLRLSAVILVRDLFALGRRRVIGNQ